MFEQIVGGLNEHTGLIDTGVHSDSIYRLCVLRTVEDEMFLVMKSS